MRVQKKGQSVSEYSIFVAIVLIAIITMNAYVKRGLQGRYVDVMDSTISAVQTQAGQDVPSQYEPYYTESQATIDAPRNISKTVTEGKATRVLSPDSSVIESTDKEKASLE